MSRGPHITIIHNLRGQFSRTANMLLAALLSFSGTASATIDYDGLSKCQTLLTEKGPQWLEQGMDTIFKLQERQLMLLNQSKLSASSIIGVVGPSIMFRDVEISLSSELYSLGLRVKSELNKSDIFIKFGPGEIISHTDGRFIESDNSYSGIQDYAHVLFPLIDPIKNTPTSTVILISLNRERGLRKVYVYTKTASSRRLRHDMDDSWFNQSGELFDLVFIAKFAVERHIGDGRL